MLELYNTWDEVPPVLKMRLSGSVVALIIAENADGTEDYLGTISVRLNEIGKLKLMMFRRKVGVRAVLCTVNEPGVNNIKGGEHAPSLYYSQLNQIVSIRLTPEWSEMDRFLDCLANCPQAELVKWWNEYVDTKMGLGNNIYRMAELDAVIGRLHPSEFLREFAPEFSMNDEYFYNTGSEYRSFDDVVGPDSPVSIETLREYLVSKNHAVYRNFVALDKRNHRRKNKWGERWFSQ